MTKGVDLTEQIILMQFTYQSCFVIKIKEK